MYFKLFDSYGAFCKTMYANTISSNQKVNVMKFLSYRVLYYNINTILVKMQQMIL